MSMELSELVPDGWRQPPPDLLVRAKGKALDATPCWASSG